MRLLQQSALFIFLLLPIPALATHAGGDTGGDIWVDGPATVQPGNSRSRPDAAMDNQGRSTYVWNAFGSDRNDIYLRRFDATGNPLKDPIRINTFIDKDQDSPRVAVSDDDSFLVVWLSREPPTSGAALRANVRSQAFNENAQPVGSEQLLNTLTTNQTSFAKTDVAALPGGGYIVVWRSANTPEADTSTTIQARRIGANGVPLAGQFQVNSTITSAAESFPAVTELADGGFLVVWTTPQVHGRRFAANGTPVGGDFQINTFIAGSEAETDVVLGLDGKVMVVWKDTEDTASDREIRGRLFSQNLVAQGSDFRINTFTSGDQDNVRVGDYGAAGFFVVWESVGSVGNDNEINSRSIQGRIVTGSDQFKGGQFQLNVWTTGNQQFPGIGGRDGEIAVAWRSRQNAESTDPVIIGQIWSLCGIYCDGFE